MLSEGDVVATIAVNDIERGKDFYGGTLGLPQTMENPGGVGYSAGSGQLFVYASPTAGSGEATSAFFRVDDVRSTVAELRDKGVAFEHYDMPGSSLDGDIHRMDGSTMEAAWFKDPDGNIIGVGNG